MWQILIIDALSVPLLALGRGWVGLTKFSGLFLVHCFLIWGQLSPPCYVFSDFRWYKIVLGQNFRRALQLTYDEA